MDYKLKCKIGLELSTGTPFHDVRKKYKVSVKELMDIQALFEPSPITFTPQPPVVFGSKHEPYFENEMDYATIKGPLLISQWPKFD